MAYKPKDFERLKFNIHELSSNKKVVDVFPELQRYPILNELPMYSIDHDKVLRYIIYCYDRRTPLLQEADLISRKKHAIELAGLKWNDSSVKIMVDNKIDQVNRMIVQYVRIQKNLKFSLLVTLMENYFNTIQKVSSDELFNQDGDLLKEAESKAKLSKLLPGMLDDIESLPRELFLEDKDLMYTADDMAQEEKENIIDMPWPEKMAISLSDKINEHIQKT